MSLMKTLAKVAVGVALAKGAKSMMDRGRQQSAGGAAPGGGLGGLLGGLTQNAGGAQPHGGAFSPGAAGAGGGLEGMLGGLLGGGATGGQGAPGGLGGLLEQLGGGGAAGAGGLGGMLGGLAGAVAGGNNDLLAGTDETLRRRPEQANADFGTVLNSQFDDTPVEAIEPSRDQEAAAALMLAAMIQAAKSDGTFDEAEKDKLLNQLGDVDAEEAAFVREQMQRPVDVNALVQQTPRGMGKQVYAMSLLGIDLDTQDEAQYLHQLAQGYGLQPAEVNEIHSEMGVPSLYT